jgi:anti-sigma factor RsiW
MGGHLSAQDLERYRQRTLSPAEWLAAEDHIATCEACRRQLGEAEPLPEEVAALWAAFRPEAGAKPEHLSYEQLAAYVDDELDEVDREIVESHLELCPTCEAAVRDLRALQAEMAVYPAREYAPTPVPTFWERFLAFWRRRPGDAALLAALARDPLRIAGISAQARAMILRKVPLGQPVLLPFQPSPLPAMRRGAEAALALLLLSPQPEEVLLEPQVHVGWTEVAGGPEYQVTVYRASRKDKPWRERKVTQTSLTVSLAYGEAYSVQVKAVGREALTPEIPFRVLSRREAGELQRSHLLRGIFHEQQGRLSQALAEYQALREAHPDSALAREMDQQLRRTVEE